MTPDQIDEEFCERHDVHWVVAWDDATERYTLLAPTHTWEGFESNSLSDDVFKWAGLRPASKSTKKLTEIAAFLDDLGRMDEDPQKWFREQEWEDEEADIQVRKNPAAPLTDGAGRPIVPDVDNT